MLGDTRRGRHRADRCPLPVRQSDRQSPRDEPVLPFRNGACSSCPGTGSPDGGAIAPYRSLERRRRLGSARLAAERREPRLGDHAAHTGRERELSRHADGHVRARWNAQISVGATLESLGYPASGGFRTERYAYGGYQYFCDNSWDTGLSYFRNETKLGFNNGFWFYLETCEMNGGCSGGPVLAKSGTAGRSSR